MNVLLLGLLLGCTLSATATAAQKVVLYGDDDYAPYSFVEGGQFKGIYVDILKKAAEQMAPAYEVEFKPVPWKRGLAELEAGRILALFPPYLRKERGFIQPYSTPIFRETVVLFCNNEVMATPRKNFPDDFKGLKVGINLGFVLSDKLNAASKSGVITLQEAKGNDGNLKKLAAKRIDCYANDRGSILYSIKTLTGDPDIAQLKLTEAVELSGEDAFIGYSSNAAVPYKADFIEKMNAALEALKASGDAGKVADMYK